MKDERAKMKDERAKRKYKCVIARAVGSWQSHNIYTSSPDLHSKAMGILY